MRASALESSRDAARAEIAAHEARAQAVGDYGIHGVVVFRRWLVATGRIEARHVVAQATEELPGGRRREWTRWVDGTIDMVERDPHGSVWERRSDEAPVGLRWVCTTTLRPMAELTFNGSKGGA